MTTPLATSSRPIVVGSSTNPAASYLPRWARAAAKQMAAKATAISKARRRGRR
jgi:hypothetical protein